MARPRNFKVIIDGTKHSARECPVNPMTNTYQDKCPNCKEEQAVLQVECTQYGFEIVATVFVYKCAACNREWFKEYEWKNGQPHRAKTPLTA